MTRFYKILLYGLSITLISWLLPWLYNLATLKSSRTPFTLYSEIINDFASLSAGDGKDSRVRRYSWRLLLQ